VYAIFPTFSKMKRRCNFLNVKKRKNVLE